MCRCAERRRQIAAAVTAYVKGDRAEAGTLVRQTGATLREDAASVAARVAKPLYRLTQGKSP